MEIDQIERVVTSPTIELSELTASRIFDCRLKILPQDLSYTSFSIEDREVRVHIDLQPVGAGQSAEEADSPAQYVSSLQASPDNRLDSP